MGAQKCVLTPPGLERPAVWLGMEWMCSLLRHRSIWPQRGMKVLNVKTPAQDETMPPTFSADALERLLTRLRIFPPGYQYQDPAMQTVLMASLRLDPKVRPLQLHRFNYPSWVEPGRERYNINQIADTKLFLSEGPAPVSEDANLLYGLPDPTSMARLFETTLYHPTQPIQRFLVAGRADDSVGFENYFGGLHQRGPRQYEGDFRVEHDLDATGATDLRREGRLLIEHRLRVHHGDQHRALQVYQLIQMPDFGTATLTPADLVTLRDLFVSLEHTPLNVHCAAGLGRSGLIALTYLLWRDFKTAVALESEMERAQWVMDQLRVLRNSRPGTVQNQAQLEQAVVLANQLWGLKNSE